MGNDAGSKMDKQREIERGKLTAYYLDDTGKHGCCIGCGEDKGCKSEE